ncbi:hypothetical protein Ade02nite_61640 [Paractinoplanes deccanensis]|uniref:DUF4331 domain-containing protein n=1 Tax=Paractinoplanes deccanensis TaxID=113561 RepID=A0ABQ3YC23_9ACTN|nr:DUF4331 family protein [Actinoplanes deccanensis]GID77523.1 hypothetical protein Ade02nite_61640 [Actinoplanes deccanensis]
MRTPGSYGDRDIAAPREDIPMSHHLDSPQARQDPRLNITDQYVFDDLDATVLVMNVRTSLAGGATADGFHPEARYEFRVHLDDAPAENLVFGFTFAGKTMRVTRDGAEVAAGLVGAPIDGADGLRVWAGRALDPFFLDLSQLAAVDRLLLHGEDADITGFLPGKAANSFESATVWSIVLRVPHRDGQLFPDRMIRVWSASLLATDAGGRRQAGRAGLPMIWPIFRDADGDAASEANATHPGEDWARYGGQIRGLVAAAVRRLGTSARPEAYALAVAQRILPDTLPYQVGTAAVFGFTDFNGRHLSDNAAEVMFSLATNSAVSTGLTAARMSDEFPYVTPSALDSH